MRSAPQFGQVGFMSPVVLKTFNQYVGREFSADDAKQHLRSIPVLPLPDRLMLDDWRAHVPMHLLEGWRTLGDEERMTILIMAQSATHTHESGPMPDEPRMN